MNKKLYLLVSFGLLPVFVSANEPQVSMSQEEIADQVVKNVEQTRGGITIPVTEEENAELNKLARGAMEDVQKDFDRKETKKGLIVGLLAGIVASFVVLWKYFKK